MKIRLLLLITLVSPFVSAKTHVEDFLHKIPLQHFFSGIRKVDCLYVINLKYRLEKWKSAKSTFNSYRIYPNRVNAINGWLLSEEDKQLLMGHYPLKLRGGEIGCILSHLSVLRHAFKKKYKVVWICEDDIEICENPHQLSDLIVMLTTIDPDWDVLYTDSDSKNEFGIVVPSLGNDFRPDFPHMDLNYYTQSEIINDDLIKKNQRFGAYSYIVSKKGIKKILEHFINNYLWTAYDIDIHYVPGIRQYCIRRDLVSINWKHCSDTEKNRE